MFALNNSKTGKGYLVRGFVALAIVALLTWYGKFAHHKPSAAREHELVAWLMPTAHGLSSLIVTPDDNRDTNLVHNGLRLWLNPPRQPNALENEDHALYRGSAMVLIGDSLELGSVSQSAAMVDTGGRLRILGRQTWSSELLRKSTTHLQFEVTPPQTAPWNWLGDLLATDMAAQLSFTADSARSHVLTLEWNGYRARWWGTIASAAADSIKDSLSIGVISECVDKASALPHAHDPRIKTLVYCGASRPGLDSTRMALQGNDAGVLLVEDAFMKRLFAKRVHMRWDMLSE